MLQLTGFQSRTTLSKLNPIIKYTNLEILVYIWDRYFQRKFIICLLQHKHCIQLNPTYTLAIINSTISIVLIL